MKIRKPWNLFFSSIYFRHLRKSYTTQDSMAAVSCPASSQVVYHQGKFPWEVYSERVVLSRLKVTVKYLKPRAGLLLLWSCRKSETHLALIFMASTKVRVHNSHFSLPTWHACLVVSLVLLAPADYTSEAWTWQYFFLAVVRLSPESPSLFLILLRIWNFMQSVMGESCSQYCSVVAC